MCGGIATADVRDERYEVNHCSKQRNAKQSRKTEQDGLVESIKGSEEIKKKKARDLLHKDGIRKMVM